MDGTNWWDSYEIVPSTPSTATAAPLQPKAGNWWDAYEVVGAAPKPAQPQVPAPIEPTPPPLKAAPLTDPDVQRLMVDFGVPREEANRQVAEARANGWNLWREEEYRKPRPQRESQFKDLPGPPTPDRVRYPEYTQEHVQRATEQQLMSGMGGGPDDPFARLAATHAIYGTQEARKGLAEQEGYRTVPKKSVTRESAEALIRDAEKQGIRFREGRPKNGMTIVKEDIIHDITGKPADEAVDRLRHFIENESVDTDRTSKAMYDPSLWMDINGIDRWTTDDEDAALRKKYDIAETEEEGKSRDQALRAMVPMNPRELAQSMEELAQPEQEKDYTPIAVKMLENADALHESNLIGYLRQVPQHDWPVLYKQLEQVAKTKGHDRAYIERIFEGLNEGILDMGLGMRDLASLKAHEALAGLESMGLPVEGLHGWLGDRGMANSQEELDAARQALGTVRQEAGAIAPEDPWYKKAPIQTGQMAPAMARDAALGALTGGAATAAGAGKWGVRAAQAAGITAGMYPQAYRNAELEMKAMGVNEYDAQRIATVVGLAEGVIESYLPNPFEMGGENPAAKGLKAKIRQYAKGYLKNYSGELTEEVLQGLSHGLGKMVATQLDANAPDQGLGDAFIEMWESGRDAAAPLALLMGGTAASGVSAEYTDGQLRKEALSEAQDYRRYSQARRDVAKAGGDPNTVKPEDYIGTHEKPATEKERVGWIADQVERLKQGAVSVKDFLSAIDQKAGQWAQDHKLFDEPNFSEPAPEVPEGVEASMVQADSRPVPQSTPTDSDVASAMQGRDTGPRTEPSFFYKDGTPVEDSTPQERTEQSRQAIQDAEGELGSQSTPAAREPSAREEWFKKNKQEIGKRRWKKVSDDLEQQEREMWEDPTRAAQWVEMDPEAAQALASKKTHKPKDFEEAGLPVPPDPALRRQWKQMVRELLKMPKEVREAKTRPAMETLSNEWQTVPEGIQVPDHPSIEKMETPHGTIARWRQTQSESTEADQVVEPDEVVPETPSDATQQQTNDTPPVTPVESTQQEPVTEVAEVPEVQPEAVEEAPVGPPSEFRTNAENALARVPFMQDAKLDFDEEGKTVTATLPDGSSSTISFGDDATMESVAKAKGLKNPPRGMYVRNTVEVDGKTLVKGNVYLGSDADYRTLNHELVHWLQDLGVITEAEVREHGILTEAEQATIGRKSEREGFTEDESKKAREGFAIAYTKAIEEGKLEGVFARIQEFMKRLLGDKEAKRRKLFESLPERTAAKGGTVQQEVAPKKSMNDKATPATEQKAPEAEQSPEPQPEPETDDLNNLKRKDLRAIVDEEGVDTSGLGRSPTNKAIAERIREHRKNPTQNGKVKNAWEHPLYTDDLWVHAQDVARGVAGGQNIPEGDVADVATDALTEALNSYDPEKANGKTLENWVGDVVSQEVGKFAGNDVKANAGKQQLGEGEQAVVDPNQEGVGHAEVREKALKLKKLIDDRVRDDEGIVFGVNALMQEVEGVSFTEQARQELSKDGNEPDPKNVESRRKHISRKAAAATAAIEELAKNDPEVKEALDDLRMASVNSKGGRQQFGMAVSNGPGIAASGIPIPDMSGLGKKVGNLFRKFFTAPGEMPESVYDRNVAREGYVAKQMRKLQFLSTDLNRAIKAKLKSQSRLGNKAVLTTQELVKINSVLKGEESHDSLPEEVRPAVQALRDHVDSLSLELIRRGVAQGELIGTIMENEGVYLHRSYEVFDNTKWHKDVPVEVRNRAIAFLRMKFPEKTDAQIHGLIEALLRRGKAKSPVSLMKQAKLGAKDMSVLMKKKDIPKPIRDLWGEYTDPNVNYTRTVHKIANLIANHDFLEGVKQDGLGTFLSEPDNPIETEYGSLNTRVAAKEDASMSPLNGYYTTPELAEAFANAYDETPNVAWVRWLLGANSLVKYNKTVLSGATHVRNFVANPLFLVANGHWKFKGAKQAFKTLAADLTNLGDAEMRAYIMDLTERGVLGQEVNLGEVRDAIKDMRKARDFEKFMSDVNARKAKLLVDIGVLGKKAIEGLYYSEDALWKVMAFEGEKARYRAAHPEWSEEQIRHHAAEIVKNTMPTYSKVGKAMKAMRRFPLMGDFVSFQAEVYRTRYHSIRIAFEEMRDQKTRAIGAQRLAGNVLAHMIPSAMSVMSMMLAGISWQDDKDIVTSGSVPEWEKNNERIYYGRDDDGKIKYIDVTYSNPFACFSNALRAYQRGDGLVGGLVGASDELLGPITKEGILAKHIREVWSNKTDTGRVYNPGDTGWGIAYDATAHLWDAIEPGEKSSIDRMRKGLSGKATRSGKHYDFTTELIANITGQKRSIADPKQALPWRIREIKRELQDVESVLRGELTSRGSATGPEVEAAYDRMDGLRRQKMGEAREIVMAAHRLGVDMEDITAMLKEEKMRLSDIRILVTGEYTPLPMTKRLGERAYKSSEEQWGERREGFDRGFKKSLGRKQKK